MAAVALYHAVGPDTHYRLGALLLDLEDPGQVLHRTPDWIMPSEADYEIDGTYPNNALVTRPAGPWQRWCSL